MAMRLCWGFRSPIVELCLTGVREMLDSWGCQKLEGTQDPLLGVVRCLRVGPETLFHQGCIWADWRVGCVDCLWYFWGGGTRVSIPKVGQILITTDAPALVVVVVVGGKPEKWSQCRYLVLWILLNVSSSLLCVYSWPFSRCLLESPSD